MGHFYSITRPNPGHIYDSEIRDPPVVAQMLRMVRIPPRLVEIFIGGHTDCRYGKKKAEDTARDDDISV